MVRLPFSSLTSILGESRSTAIRALKTTFLKLKPSERVVYANFMQEYIALGHMSRVPKENINVPNFYFTHHAVIKESSTSPIRVVFNGSKKTSSQKSFNDILYAGPVVQQELFEIVIRFRFFSHRYLC